MNPLYRRVRWSEEEATRFFNHYKETLEKHGRETPPLVHLLPAIQEEIFPVNKHVRNLVNLNQLIVRLGDERVEEMRSLYVEHTECKRVIAHLSKRPKKVVSKEVVPVAVPQDEALNADDFKTLIAEMRNSILNALDAKLDQLRNSIIDDVINLLEMPEDKASNTSLPTQKEIHKRRVVVLGLWDGAISTLKDREEFFYIDVRYCKENTDIEGHIKGPTTIVQMIKSSAHLPKGLSSKFNEHIHCNGGYSKLRDILQQLENRYRMIYEDDIELPRRHRGLDAPVLIMEDSSMGYSSSNNWTLSQENGKEEGKHLNGRWVLRNEQGTFMDCSYNLDLLTSVNNLELKSKHF